MSVSRSALVEAMPCSSSAEDEEPWEAVSGDGVHSEWIARAAEAVAGAGDRPDILSDSMLAKDQLVLVQKYTRICDRLQAYGAKLLTKQRPLVPVRFPIRPLPNTRVAMDEMIGRSFANFCRHVHHTTLSVGQHRLAPMTPNIMAEVVEFVQVMAGAMWSEMRRVIDDETSELEARQRLIRRCGRFAKTSLENHRKRLGSARNHCHAAIEELEAFCANRMLSKRQTASLDFKDATVALAARAKPVRQWVRGVLRRGWGLAFETACARDSVQKRMEARLGDAHHQKLGTFLDALERARRDTSEDRALWDCDAWASEVYLTLAEVAPALRDVLHSERTELDWLLAEDADQPCWCTLGAFVDTPAVASGTVDGALLQAPAHMATFSQGRVRVVANPNFTLRLFHSELPSVRLASILAQLLQQGHLFLHRIGCDYANRIVVCEYCKYERAIMRIEADTLIPFGDAIGVPYRSRIPDLATARQAQKRPLPPPPLGAPNG